MRIAYKFFSIYLCTTLLFACDGVKEGHYPDIEINLFRDAFIKNKVSGYVILYQDEDEIYGDSTLLDQNGNDTLIIGVNRFMFNYEWKSWENNRLIERIEKTDFKEHSTFEYSLDHQNNQVIQMEVDFYKKNIISRKVFQFDDELDKLLAAYKFNLKGDTIEVNKFTYDGRNLTEIRQDVPKHPAFGFITRITYKEGKLDKIQLFSLLNELEQTFHISHSTGLIDSIKFEVGGNVTLEYF